MRGIGQAGIELSQAKAQKRMQQAQLDESEARAYNSKAQGMYYDAMSAKVLSDMNRASQAVMSRATGDKKIPNLFSPFFAQDTGEVVYFVNRDAGLEPNEAVGTGYWLRATQFGQKNRPNVAPMPQDSYQIAP